MTTCTDEDLLHSYRMSIEDRCYTIGVSTVEPLSAEELDMLRELAAPGGIVERILATLDARDEEIEELVRQVEKLKLLINSLP